MAYVAAGVEARAAVGTQSIVRLTRMIVMLCYNNTQRQTSFQTLNLTFLIVRLGSLKTQS